LGGPLNPRQSSRFTGSENLTYGASEGLRAMLGSSSSRRSAGRTREPRPLRLSPWEVQVAAFLAHKRSADVVGEAWLARMRWELNRFPSLLRRVGRDVELRAASEVSGDSIRALRAGLPWESTTFAIHFQALRQFLRWGGNPIASERAHWRLPTGAPVHRRWLRREQLVQLYRGSRGVERVIVGLEGFAGLRRVEVLRLRVKDILAEDGCMRILGKGRGGGKWRTIPLQGEVARVLHEWVTTLRPDDRVVPLSRSGADAALRRAAVRSGLAPAGVKVSHHDLRRSFGRLAHASGISLVSIQGLFGHASPALSAHYIGLDLDELKTALERLGSYIDSGPTVERDHAIRAPSRGNALRRAAAVQSR
jgi:integrase